MRTLHLFAGAGGSLYAGLILGWTNLGKVVAMMPTLLATDGKHSGPGMNRKGGSILELAGGTLNPAWCEWFMGWPIDATELPHSATVGCRRRRRSRGGCLEGQ
jgi:hypothetical protein